MPLFRSLSIIAAICVVFAAPTPSNAEYVTNENGMEIHIPKASDKIHIDGRLDDPMWRNAQRIANFTEVNPGENVPPKAQTEAFFTYDHEKLYVGFRCHDDDPSQIRASITDRDNIFQDDFVGIMIDTFSDQQNGYEFFVNPHGIQGDLRRTANNEDSSYDTVWMSAGRITDDGWTAEMAIPFRSLRFPDKDVQEWGLHVLRIRPRDSREQISWMPISRDDNCFFCLAGRMNGIQGINHSSNLEVLPYAISSQSSGFNNDTRLWEKGSGEGEAGVGIKYGITSNLTADVTINPDFSQIEADASQIDVNQTFALSFPERRPFFQEGADIFNSKVDAVYTRAINDPLVAGKITGKIGRTTVGIISAMDTNSPYVVPFEERSERTSISRKNSDPNSTLPEGETYSNIVRLKRDVGGESWIGLMATDRRAPTVDGSNTVGGADWRLKFLSDFTFEGQVMASNTREPNDETMSEGFNKLDTFGKDNQYTAAFDGENFNGFATELGLGRNGRHYNNWLWYEDYSPTFRAETGFVRQNNFRRGGMWNGYMMQFDDHKFFERVEPQIDIGWANNYNGAFKDEWYQPSLWVRFRKQTSIWTAYTWSSERFADVHVHGIRRWRGEIWSDYSKALSGGVSTQVGRSLVRDTDDPRLGKEHYVGGWATIKPTSRFVAGLNYDYFRLNELSGEEIVTQWVGRARLQYQFTQKLFLRVITEYVEPYRYASFDPLLSYKVNPFTVFFAGSSHNFSGRDFNDERNVDYYQHDRVFFIKLQYLFRV